MVQTTLSRDKRGQRESSSTTSSTSSTTTSSQFWDTTSTATHNFQSFILHESPSNYQILFPEQPMIILIQIICCIICLCCIIVVLLMWLSTKQPSPAYSSSQTEQASTVKLDPIASSISQATSITFSTDLLPKAVLLTTSAISINARKIPMSFSRLKIPANLNILSTPLKGLTSATTSTSFTVSKTFTSVFNTPTVSVAPTTTILTPIKFSSNATKPASLSLTTTAATKHIIHKRPRISSTTLHVSSSPTFYREVLLASINSVKPLAYIAESENSFLASSFAPRESQLFTRSATPNILLTPQTTETHSISSTSITSSDLENIKVSPEATSFTGLKKLRYTKTLTPPDITATLEMHDSILRPFAGSPEKVSSFCFFNHSDVSESSAKSSLKFTTTEISNGSTEDYIDSELSETNVPVQSEEVFPVKIRLPRPRNNRYLVCEYDPIKMSNKHAGLTDQNKFSFHYLPLRICTHVAYFYTSHISNSIISFPDDLDARLIHRSIQYGLRGLSNFKITEHIHAILMHIYKPRPYYTNDIQDMQKQANAIVAFSKSYRTDGIVLDFSESANASQKQTNSGFTTADLLVAKLRFAWPDMFCLVGFLPMYSFEDGSYITEFNIISAKCYLILLRYVTRQANHQIEVCESVKDDHPYVETSSLQNNLQEYIHYSFMKLSLNTTVFMNVSSSNSSNNYIFLKHTSYDQFCKFAKVEDAVLGCAYAKVPFTNTYLTSLSLASGLGSIAKRLGKLRGFYATDIHNDMMTPSCGDQPYPLLRYLHNFLMENLTDITDKK